MAHAARVLTSKPIPPGATTCTLRGRPAVRWKGRAGRVIVAAVSESDPTKCLLESRKWYAHYRNEHGKPAKAPGFEDKAATERLAVDLETRAARIASGIMPAESLRASPLAERLDRWRDYLVHRGGTQDHANRQRRRVEVVYALAAVDRPAELTPVLVLRALDQLRREPISAKGFGQNSAAHYIGACKQFSRWCVLRDKSESVDHLAGLEREYTESKRKRRALSPANFAKLIKAAAGGRVVRRLTGTERSILYQVAASTGLRVSELASLKPANFNLGKSPSVTVEAAYAKNRRTDTLPLPTSLVKPLKALLAERKPGEHVWPVRGLRSRAWSTNAAAMLAVDLAAAGLPVLDERGHVFDFHSLRVQFATDLEQAGASLSRAQRHMRHSTPALTANLYTKHDAGDLAADVNRLRKGR